VGERLDMKRRSARQRIDILVEAIPVTAVWKGREKLSLHQTRSDPRGPPTPGQDIRAATPGLVARPRDATGRT
jgi:hypothetical protein